MASRHARAPDAFLGLSYSRAAGILEDEPDGRKQAMALYKKSIPLKQGLLAAEPNNIDFRRLLAYDQYTLGGLLAETDLNDAVKQERTALSSFEELARSDPANMQFQQDMARTRTQIGKALARMKDFSGAIEQFRLSLNLLEKLPDTTNPHSMVGFTLASDQFWMGKSDVGLAVSGKLATQQKLSYCRQAESWFHKCLPAFEQLRDHAAPLFEGAERVAEIKEQMAVCQSDIK